MLLFDSYKYSFQNGLLTSDQRRGILNLIPKPNKDLRYLKNWRPVSILNTDYKILTKALANRLQFVLPKLINSDQVGYLKNRYIGENVRIIDDIMSYTNLKQTQGYIILLDFEKAFDSVEWSFLFKTLKAFNFGPNFIKWIEIVYNSIESCVSNNGYFSQYFKLNRGIRQGCPISALLFLLVVEVMAVVIKNKKLINGINIENKEYKICQLADDTTIFVRDIESVVHLITCLKNFYNCSGLKINLEKSEIIPVGSSRFQNIYLPKIISKLTVNKNSFKTLGVWFSYNLNESISLNFENKLSSMETIINIWKCRKMSLKGKILILKSLVLPQINYLLSVCFCPMNILEKIDRLLFKFLWENKPAKIKRNTITATYTMGGLKMPDIFAINVVSKIKWINNYS